MKRKTILRLAKALEGVHEIRNEIRSIKKNIDKIKSEQEDFDDESYNILVKEIDLAILSLKRGGNSLYGFQSKLE